MERQRPTTPGKSGGTRYLRSWEPFRQSRRIDFYVYAFCANYFAPAFFPSEDPSVQLLNTAGVFAAGFLMRPIGGWLFGRVADKHGREKSMMISVLMMCAGSLVIACMPTYVKIGAWAPALLLMARLGL